MREDNSILHGTVNIARETLRGVTYYNPLKTYGRYTLFCPWGDCPVSNSATDVWLIDLEGYIVHRWRLTYQASLYAKLLPNGHLVYAAKTVDEEELGLSIEFSGAGGHIIELDWDGNEVWRWETPYQHHDFQLLPNRHILYPSQGDSKGMMPDELASRWKGGRRGTEYQGKVYSDNIYEVDENSKLVWEWIGWQHCDPDIDTFSPFSIRSHWHTNSVWKCKDGSILTSPRNLSMAHRIEYPSGKIIARYGKGEIWGQHDVRELENGNIMCFDNGLTRPGYGPSYSRVVEMHPKTGEVVWQYMADNPSDFYSYYASGAERQPNGNTLISSSATGRLFEVTYDGELVWEFINPIMSEKRGIYGGFNYRGQRFTHDYPAFMGKDLDPARYAWENKCFGPGAFSKKFEPCIF